MNTHRLTIHLLVCVASLLACFFHAAADTLVYDNSINYLGQTYSPGNSIEFGDEIFLEGGSTFLITQFKFETFVGDGGSGDETVKLRFRLNDGAVLSPGRVAPNTQLFESGPIALSSGFETHAVLGLTIPLPVDHFTWTAEFLGIDPNEQVGLVLYHPPVVGSSYTDFWQRSGTTWNTFVFPDGTPASFGAQFFAHIPDGGSTALLLSLVLIPLGYLRAKAALLRG